MYYGCSLELPHLGNSNKRPLYIFQCNGTENNFSATIMTTNIYSGIIRSGGSRAMRKRIDRDREYKTQLKEQITIKDFVMKRRRINHNGGEFCLIESHTQIRSC